MTHVKENQRLEFIHVLTNICIFGSSVNCDVLINDNLVQSRHALLRLEEKVFYFYFYFYLFIYFLHSFDFCCLFFPFWKGWTLYDISSIQAEGTVLVNSSILRETPMHLRFSLPALIVVGGVQFIFEPVEETSRQYIHVQKLRAKKKNDLTRRRRKRRNRSSANNNGMIDTGKGTTSLLRKGGSACNKKIKR